MDDVNKRAPNFTVEEIVKLKELVKKYANIVECRKSDTLSNKQKIEGWKALEKEYNVCNNTGIYRNYLVLRKKWENLKKTCKKKYSDMKTYSMGTGGGSAKTVTFSSIEESILEVLGPQAKGMDSIYDCDNDNEEIQNAPRDQENTIINHNVVLPLCSPKPQLTEESEDIDVTDEEHEIHTKSDWVNYTPKMLKEPISKPLRMKKISSKDNQSPPKKKVKLDKLKEELVITQKTQFLKESEIRIKYMKEEHEMKMKKIELEILEINTRNELL